MSAQNVRFGCKFMHLLVVIGAGASYDCWPEHVVIPHDYEQVRLPLANSLFSPLPTQNAFLDKYNLMGLASSLRSKARTKGDKFDIEEELANINDVAIKRKDFNTIQSLFKARFYLHGVIKTLTQKTLNYTSSHTIYVDLLTKIKEWIDESPESRYVDIIVFNYDDLIEKAMSHVYNYDWSSKNESSPLNAYYRGKNLRIYKPHGSINWGREVLHDESHFSYTDINQAFQKFNQLDIVNSFRFINPDVFTGLDDKNYIPAIAIPFKKKANFEECPQEMLVKMLEAIQGADKVITLGWKGADEHLTILLKENHKIDEVYIVSPKADTYLDKIFPAEKLKPYESTFRYFVSDTPTLENLLSTFDKQ